jgi:uncharacterized protein YlxW (UPF0749 family)
MSAVQDTIKVARDMTKSLEDMTKGILFHLNEAEMQDQRRIARETGPLRDEIRRLQYQVDTLKAENETLRATHRTVNTLTTLRR